MAWFRDTFRTTRDGKWEAALAELSPAAPPQTPKPDFLPPGQGQDVSYVARIDPDVQLSSQEMAELKDQLAEWLERRRKGLTTLLVLPKGVHLDTVLVNKPFLSVVKTPNPKSQITNHESPIAPEPVQGERLITLDE